MKETSLREGALMLEATSDKKKKKKPQRHERKCRSVVTSTWPLHDLQNSPDCSTVAIWPCANMQRFYDGARLDVLHNWRKQHQVCSPQCFTWFHHPRKCFFDSSVSLPQSTGFHSCTFIFKCTKLFLSFQGFLSDWYFVVLPKHNISRDITPWLRESVKHHKINLSFIWINKTEQFLGWRVLNYVIDSNESFSASAVTAVVIINIESKLPCHHNYVSRSKCLHWFFIVY